MSNNDLIHRGDVKVLVSAKWWEEIDSIHAVDAVEVRHGEWIDDDPAFPDWSYKKPGMAYYCSCCLHRAGKHKHKTYLYCPWCGAKMDGGQNG